jgi:hypothetical protein
LASIPMYAIQTISGNQPRMRRVAEAAGNSFLAGTPVALNSSGYVIPWAGAILGVGTGGIIGITKEFGANLATAGVPQQQTFGSVPNEASAVNISRPYFNDGRNGLEPADPDSVFIGQVGPSQSVTQANVGLQYGLTKDSDNHWYVDTSKATQGTNTCVVIVKLDPNDQSATPRGVYFQFVAGYVMPLT